ncbi:class I SAM-dependent methyltransferase [Allosaccharopolyspora coralli]|uniref:Class I SAM-dependent methyltransferase n=1 Tax=Allosaccharopolyspora coralli TaxID=2665642 RepID=A0A5Q3QBB4_9PSEU|nr:class I SAM-dependent methyltransferase [Allosaccharopolyspora coralli]QGK68899.1 class I SAM-dependent methyltransferase [Allosaccharopolyspora coralli]
MAQPSRPSSEPEFERAWAHAAQVKGWMTRGQARQLWQAVRRLGTGAVVVEIGSHHGRSTLILGAAARTVGASVVAVDPFVGGPMFGGAATKDLFEKNIATAGLDDVVELVERHSTALRPEWTRPIDLLYIDGKHDYWTYTDDLRWSRNLPPGGEVLVHDCFSSLGVTLGTLAKMLCGRRYVYVDRASSLARFRLQRPTARDRLRILAQLPWFLRNAFFKILLRLRLYPVARRLGHDSRYDPY